MSRARDHASLKSARLAECPQAATSIEELTLPFIENRSARVCLCIAPLLLLAVAYRRSVHGFVVKRTDFEAGHDLRDVAAFRPNLASICSVCHYDSSTTIAEVADRSRSRGQMLSTWRGFKCLYWCRHSAVEIVI